MQASLDKIGKLRRLRKNGEGGKTSLAGRFCS